MNIKVDFDNIVVREDSNDTIVKILMLKGEKGEAGATNWGAITGTLSNQTDLKNALDGKANQSDFSTVSNQVSTNTTNIGTINGQITDINSELDDFEDLFYGNATVNDEDTTITLDNTVQAKFESFDLKGNTIQNGTPTPSSPVAVNVVSGDNTIGIVGKNYYPMPSSATKNGITYTLNDNGTFNISGTATATVDFVNSVNIEEANIINGETYTLYFNALLNFYGMVAFYNGDTWLNTPLTISPNARINSATLTIPSNCNKINFVIRVGNGVTVNQNNAYCMLVKGAYTSSNLPTFEPYQGNTYNIDLPEGMELCKIGNYQDYIYKDSDKWYLHKEIGKVVFTGGSDETWNISETNASGNNRFINESIANLVVKPSADSVVMITLSNYFVPKSANQTYSRQEGLDISRNGNIHVYADSTKTYTVAQFKTWLSTHNLSVYYPLATPTNTEITYQPLIEQLNLIEQVTSKDGETNISQVNNDLPFIIYADAFANTFNGRIEGLDYKIDNCELLSNKSTTITSSSTDNEYPSAKAVYDLFNSITDGDEVSY